MFIIIDDVVCTAVEPVIEYHHMIIKPAATRRFKLCNLAASKLCFQAVQCISDVDYSLIDFKLIRYLLLDLFKKRIEATYLFI